MKYLALDYENFYSDEVGIKTLGTYNYTRHPDTRPYMLSAASSTGETFVGSPDDFDFRAVTGPDWQIVHHNASYDSMVYQRLHEEDPNTFPLPVNTPLCTADMVAYLGSPRSLAVSSHFLLGVDVSKETRNKMKGKRWDDMTPEFKAEVEQYALRDAELCLELWQKYNHLWPEHERQLSRHTARMAAYGVAVDKDYLLEGKAAMEKALGECLEVIPWGEPILSKPQFDAHCASLGIPTPKSLAKTSEEFAAWLEKYGADHKFAAAVSRYRKTNIMLSRIEAMLARCRWEKDHWRMDYSLMYYGALTGRFSGAGGSMNMQNLRRDELEGFDVRKAIIAPPGKKLVVSDLSNIEPRCGAHVTKDEVFLEKLRGSDDIYEAYARAAMRYTDPLPLKEYDKKHKSNIRQLSKAVVLGCAYGASGAKFKSIAKTMTGLELTEAEAQGLVDDFRASNPKITKTWRMLDNALKKAAGKPRFEIELPSGRIIPHFEPKAGADRNVSVLVPRLGKFMRVKLWGSNAYETVVQAAARDVFAEGILRVEAMPGCRVVLHVHDELVLEADMDVTVKEIEDAMCVPPEWAPNLPLAAEGAEMQRYSK